ncbi:hypothetical protein ACSBOB_29465 [Mesorhizobium sp. ASY16-5R]|uniref:hypothetical protein n=1 Tax=Mesorhizobium sp. ASY16-5R TaxID=3445772 RepID=UPI003F9FAC7C
MRHRSGVAFQVRELLGSAKALSFQYGGLGGARATLGGHVCRFDDAKWIEGNRLSGALFEQVEINILAAVEDSEDHHPLLLDGKDDADPAPIADDRMARGPSDPTVPLSGNVEKPRQ